MVFALIMLYIWWLREPWPLTWVAILGVVLISQLARHESPSALGFRTSNLSRLLVRSVPWLFLPWLALLILGLRLGAARPVTRGYAFSSFLMYCLWGLFQQYLLNGYFTKRFKSVNPERAPWLSAAVFSAAHTPNWFLMLVAFGAGYAAAWHYLRHRNLYFLGLAHAMTGWLIYLLVPDWISGHMYVGPGWFRNR